MGMRPYQFYHLGDVSIRPTYTRIYQDLLARSSGESGGNQQPSNQHPGEAGYSEQHSNANPASSKVKEPVVVDPDLKYITSYILQKEPIVSSMDVIKFLSETPLDEMSLYALPDKTRKNALARELLTYIQDDLRNHI